MATPPDTTRERIEALHEWYQANVMDVPLRPEVERLWFEFFRQGYNGHQLAHVIRYLRQQIARDKRNPGALKLTSLLERSEDGSLLKFAEDLGLAGYRRRAMSALPATEGAPVGRAVVGGPSAGSPRAVVAAPTPPAEPPPGETMEEARARRSRELQELSRSLGGGLRADRTPAIEERGRAPRKDPTL